MSGNRQRQCLRGVAGGDDDVELGAAMALADMAGAVAAAPPPPQAERSSGAHGDGDYGEEEEASTRLSLELGKVGVQGAAAASSACSSAGQQHKQVLPAVAAPGAGYGARPRHSALTEAEKEAKRLRRVLANRESARQTILRRQAIRDELARKVTDLASQNESMKKEKEAVMQVYLALQETNKQLREQAVAKAVAVTMDIDTAEEPAPRAEGNAASSPAPAAPPPHPGFLCATAGPPAMPVPVPVPHVWGSWPPGYDPRVGNPAALAPPPSYTHPSLFPSGGGSPGGTGAGEEDTEDEDDDDPCSLTLGLDVSGSREDKAAEARRKELTKTRQPHAPGGD